MYRNGLTSIVKGENVPLYSGQKAMSKKGFSHNVAAEVHAGKPQKQAIAIAYSKSREKKPALSIVRGRHKEIR